MAKSKLFKDITYALIFALCLSGCSSGDTRATSDPLPYYHECGNVTDIKLEQESSVSSESYNETEEQRLSEKRKEEYFEFKENDTFTPSPVVLKSETPKFGNIDTNLKSINLCGLVCPDNERECVYMCAWGYDNCLYKKTNVGMERILDKTVWGLNVIGDKLYCLMNSETPLLSHNNLSTGTGDIYCLNLADGSFSMLAKANAYNLTVTEEKFYYIVRENDEWKVYSRDLDGGDIMSYNSKSIGFCGNYMLSKLEGTNYECCFTDTSTGESFRFSVEPDLNEFTVDGDNCYYLSNSSAELYRFNMTEGTETRLNPKRSSLSFKKGNKSYSFDSNSTYIGGYAVVNSNVYTVFDFLSMRIAPDGTVDKFYAEDRGPISTYEGLFYDGEKMYTVKCRASDQTYRLVEISFEEYYDEDGEFQQVMKESNIL